MSKLGVVSFETIDSQPTKKNEQIQQYVHMYVCTIYIYMYVTIIVKEKDAIYLRVVWNVGEV